MIKGFDAASQHQELSYFVSDLECQLPSQCLHGIFNNETLNTNIKKLDQYYQ